MSVEPRLFFTSLVVLVGRRLTASKRVDRRQFRSRQMGATERAVKQRSGWRFVDSRLDPCCHHVQVQGKDSKSFRGVGFFLLTLILVGQS